MTPDEYTNEEFFLDVGDNFKLYVHDWGNQKAKHPIIFLHGGPGACTKDKHKLIFNPKVQRVIFFDQRGSGKSLPTGELKNNNSQKMVEDIEKIIKKLNLPSVILTGGSWGSCLALLFAIKYPRRVKAMVLNGIFTGRKSEIDYLDKGKFRAFFPDLWERYEESVPKEYKDDPSAYHYKNALGSSSKLAKQSAYDYSLLEGPLLDLDDRYEAENFEEFDHTGTKVELYYLKNDCFIPDNYVFNNAHKLTMPVWLIQGRYDMVCPPVTAYELNKLLPNSKLIWTLSGHKMSRESWALVKLIQEQIATS